MITTPLRRVHVYTEKENDTQCVFSHKGKDHGGFKNCNLHRTPLTEINGQKRTVPDGDQIKKRLIDTCVAPGDKKGRRSLKLDDGTKSLDLPEDTFYDNKEEADTQHEAENIQKKQDPLSMDSSSWSSVKTTITTSKPDNYLTSCHYESVTFNLISSSVEPIHCNSSSVISLTSINSEDLEESHQHNESFLIEEFVSDVISKAQRIVTEESVLSVDGLDEANQAKEGLDLIQDTESNGTNVSSEADEQPQSWERNFNFTDVNFGKENVDKVVNQSLPPSYFEDSPSKEEEFLELVSIRSSPALEEVLESSGEEGLLAYEDSCLSQDLEQGVEDISEISLQNFFQLQQEMPEGEDKKHCNLLLQLTPSKILSGAPRIVPVYEHAAFAKSEYEIALCSGNLWHSRTRKESVTSPSRYIDRSSLTSPQLLTSRGNDGVAIKDLLDKRENQGETVHLSLQDTAVGEGVVTAEDNCTLMTPTKSHDKECGTSPLAVCHAAQMTTPVSSCETSTHMTPSKSHDKECGTSPVTICHVGQMTTPVSLENAETCTSPLSTSPLRLSNFTRRSENSMALMDQMKSSYISNKLLRREVSSLKKHRTLWEEHLQKEQQEMRKKLSMIKHQETEIHQTKQAVKASVQNEIDDLLTQVGQQLTQIGELEQVVQQKDEEITNLKKTNEEKKKKYCDEVKELQDDLCLAYKQHEIEVTEMKDKLEKQTSYENLYHKLMAKNRKLEEEALCFTELKESLLKATEMQKKMTILSETFTCVKSLFQQTLAEKSALSVKQQELDGKEGGMSERIQMLSDENQHLMRETERLQDMVEEEKKKSIFVETERERLQDELMASQQENNSLQKSLKEALQEIETLKSDGEGLRGEITKLKDAELLLKNSQQEKEDKLQSEISDVRNESLKMKEKLDEMDELSKRLINELESLKAKYSESVQKEHSLKVQLKDEQESKEFVQTEFESMEEYAKEMEVKVKTSQQDLDNCKGSLQDAQNAMQNYELMVQNIGEHLRICKNELEHTRQRAHHMIMHQGAQISSASDALQDLTNRLVQSFPEIGNDGALGSQDAKNPTSQVDDETPTKDSSKVSSLVFSILNSPLSMRDRPGPYSRGSTLNASPSDSSNNDSISPVEYSSSQSQDRNLIGQSANSAFSRVQSTSSSREERDFSLGEHVQKVDNLLIVLTEKIYHKMQTSKQKIEDLEEKSESLMKDLQKSRKQYDSYIVQLQNQLQHSELQVRNLRQELQTACSRTYDDQEKLHFALREAQAAEMCTSQNNEQKLTIIRMQKEIEKLVKELKLAEQNQQAYQEQVTSLANLISNKGSPDIKQTMALLSKISAEHTKLKKEMRIVEENWQKAEAEVKSLDSLFNHCVKLLENVPLHVRNNDKNLQTLTGIFLSP